MKKSKKGATLVMAMPLALATLTVGAPTMQALPLAQGICRTTQSRISKAQKLNGTTVEVIYTDGKRLTIDFYGENIFRLFRDDNGGIVRNPQADPHADILVPNARRATEKVCLKDNGSDIEIATARTLLRIDKQTGCFTVTNKETGDAVVESLEPIAFDNHSTTLTLRAHAGEYFYGGGVQNGRFSHKGKAIAIENTNNWVDGGVASPTPFYWSTKGYGVMWHTFKPGRYDFGATEGGKVILTHQEDYLDAFIMVDREPVALLNDFYQLTGNPVPLPKFGF